MKEYTSEELRKNPIAGYFWMKIAMSDEYMRIVEIHDSLVGLICKEKYCRVCNLPIGLVFYGPIPLPKRKKIMDAEESVKMDIKLIFHDWINEKGESIYVSEEGVRLSSGDLHSGTTFSGYIRGIHPSELKDAAQKGYFPLFQVVLD
jgi:hypothetical protein